MSKEKCELNDRFINACDALNEIRGRSHNNSGGGFAIKTLMNTNSYEMTASLPVLYSGKHNKKGIVLNFCPFCGIDFQPIFKER